MNRILKPGRALTLGVLMAVLLQTLWSLPPAALAHFPPARWIE